MKLLIFLLLISLSGFSQTFVNMPPLTRGEAKMLEKGIVDYIASYPDSISSSLYAKLENIRLYLESNSSTPVAFTNIPMKIIDYIESRHYQGSIYNWRESNSTDKRQIDMEQANINRSQIELGKKQSELLNKISFQKKYFELIGLPAPTN